MADHLKRAFRILLLVQVAALGLLLAGPPSAFAGTQKRAARPKPVFFTEADRADVIIRYYTDETSYMLKPLRMDGAFRSTFDRTAALKLAADQPHRDLAAVVLIHYIKPGQEAEVRDAWVADLTRLGYKRVVFLLGNNKMQANGLPVIAAPAPLTPLAAN